MDALIEFLPLVIFLLVFLRLLVRKGKKPQQPAKPLVSQPQVTGGTAAPSPFEDLIRRIEKAAEEAARQNTARGQGAPPARPVALPHPGAQPPRPVPSELRSMAAFQRAEADFVATERAVTEPTPLERGITLERPASVGEFHSILNAPREAVVREPEFHPIYDLSPADKALHESHRVAAGPAPSAHMPSLDMPGAHLHDRRTAAATRQHPLVTVLKAPGGMRTAFILKEILDRRRPHR